MMGIIENSERCKSMHAHTEIIPSIIRCFTKLLTSMVTGARIGV